MREEKPKKEYDTTWWIKIKRPEESPKGRQEDLVAERDFIVNDKPQTPGSSTQDPSIALGKEGEDWPSFWGEESNK